MTFQKEGSLVAWLEDIVRTTAGPYGKAAAIESSIVSLTKVSGEAMRQIVEWLKVPNVGENTIARRLVNSQHPFTKLWAQTVKGTRDAGWLLLWVSLYIIKWGGRMEKNTLLWTPPIIDLSSTLCKEWCKKFLFSPENTVKINVQNVKQLLSIAMNTVSPNTILDMSKQSIAVFSSKIVRGFLAALNEQTNTLDPCCIRCLKVKNQNPDLSCSEVLDGVLIDWPLPAEFLMYAPGGKIIDQNGKVALYDLCLEPDVGETPGAEVKIQSVSQKDAFRNLKKLLVAMRGNGVTVLASQKTIHRSARIWLCKHGILPLERLSNRHIDAVRLATGAALITSGSVAALQQSTMGRVTSITETTLNGKKFIKITGPSQHVSTVVLKHPHTNVLEEAERIVTRAISSLVGYMRSSVASPGAGVTELLLARHLEIRSKYIEHATSGVVAKLSKPMRETVQAVAKTLSNGLREWVSIVTCVASKDLRDIELRNAIDKQDEIDNIASDMGIDPFIAKRFNINPLKLGKQRTVSRENGQTMREVSATLLSRSDRTTHMVTGVTRLHGCRPPPGSVFRCLTTVVPGAERGAAVRHEAAPSLCKTYVSHRSECPETMTDVCSRGDGGELLPGDLSDGMFPVFDSTDAKYQAICSGLDISVMLLRTNDIVIDTT